MNFSRKLSIVFAVTALAAVTQMIGCTNTISGDTRTNIVPTVEFVNVPPANQSFSQNPEINWIGKDVDGQIVLFRFAVITEDEIIASIGGGATSPLSDMDVQGFVDVNIKSLSDSIWTDLTVDQQGGNPRTSNIIPMKAELSDPVNTFVAQFVFVEAIDEEGGRSNIAFRRFLRNDNPPNTFIRAFDDKKTFINAVVSTSFATGVRVRWAGDDPIDFPSDAPPFEFEWRLYGPYVSDTSINGPGIFEQLVNQFVKVVFVTSDAKAFVFGTGASFPVCRDVVDTINGGLIEICDTVLVDTIQENNSLGVIDTLFDVDDSLFANNPVFNRITAQSFDGIDEWTTDKRDSLFNLFRDEQATTTLSREFIFWVRARDDANVPDVTPAFVPFLVVDPKFERDIAIVDVMLGATVNAAIRDSARAYWRDAIATFGGSDYQDAGINPSDSANDYLVVSQSSGNVLPLEFMLGHKALIVMGDDTKPGVLKPVLPKLATAINAGLNVWLAMRSPISGGEGSAPEIPIAVLPPEYISFFGVSQLVYSGWDFWARANFPFQRYEDFSGATSLKQNIWPDITIDSANLFNRYKWTQHSFPNRGVFPFLADRGPDSNQVALPEVDWIVRIPGTEPMYLYKSIYGPEHPLGRLFSFDGRPVMIRFNTGLFRTAHSLFTPMAFEPDSMQVLLNGMLAWLLANKINPASPSAGLRYPDAPNPSAAIARIKEYWRQKEAETEFLEPITYGVKNIKNRR